MSVLESFKRAPESTNQNASIRNEPKLENTTANQKRNSMNADPNTPEESLKSISRRLSKDEFLSEGQQ